MALGVEAVLIVLSVEDSYVDDGLLNIHIAFKLCKL